MDTSNGDRHTDKDTAPGKKQLAMNIRRLRLLSRMTQTELAHAVSQYLPHPTSHFQVCLQENGTRKISGTFLRAYARVFKVPAKLLYADLVTEEEFRKAVAIWYDTNAVQDASVVEPILAL